MTVTERLLRYVRYDTVALPQGEGCPSNPDQLIFARALVEEMRSLGIADAAMDENGFVTGTIPANVQGDIPVIGLLAHMDVSCDAPSANIRPRIIENYDGGEIPLGESGLVLSPADTPCLLRHRGMDLIVTDGTTLLGADDKAGIAELMTAAERLLSDPGLPHGVVKLAFTPDEEIGTGIRHFNVPAFGADFAYTFDGGAFGAIAYETFNAATANITVTGKSIHPGHAKGVMKNSLRIAMELDALLPHAVRPEYTEGYEGFFHLTNLSGAVGQTKMTYILRDHDYAKLTEKKRVLGQIADFLNARYGEGTVVIDCFDLYRNMAEPIREKCWDAVEIAREVIRELGGEPVSEPVRGGTDGSQLSFMGLPTPNLGYGGYNAHGKYEYACIQEMELCMETALRILARYAEKGQAKA